VSKEKIFKLYCDSSSHSTGSVLAQGESKEEVVISYGSKKLNESPMRYSTWQRELSASYHFCMRFRYYLQGAEYFKVFTDHKGLFKIHQKDMHKHGTLMVLTVIRNEL
jgi:hypothetical protein